MRVHVCVCAQGPTAERNDDEVYLSAFEWWKVCEHVLKSEERASKGREEEERGLFFELLKN